MEMDESLRSYQFGNSPRLASAVVTFAVKHEEKQHAMAGLIGDNASIPWGEGGGTHSFAKRRGILRLEPRWRSQSELEEAQGLYSLTGFM